MAENDPNRANLVRVATALGDFRQEVAFVGGAVVGLLLTDEAAPRIRATNDVDVIVALAKPTDYHLVLMPTLKKLGFREYEGDVICRWKVGDVIVDVMPNDAAVLGFTNRWYKGAIETADVRDLGDVSIRLITAPYFIATKLEAFSNRGRRDFAASHDLEDVLAVVNGRSEIAEEIVCAPHDVRAYIDEQFAALLADRGFMNVLAGIVERGRESIVEARLRDVCDRCGR
jgi:predicted nucleotidyltransferase